MTFGQEISKWDSLIILGLSKDEAIEIFKTIGTVLALHPTNNPVSKPIAVTFRDPSRDADHFLFRADTDTTGREFAMQERPVDFQMMRSERINWIRPILENPDVIYEDVTAPGCFLYVCRTSLTEQFAVLVRRVSAKQMYFVTAYTIDPQKWKAKLGKLRKVHPRKRATSSK